jgi:LysM repeat protein
MTKVLSIIVFSLIILCSANTQNTSLQVYVDNDSKPYVLAKLADFGSIYHLSKSFNISINEIMKINGFRDANSIGSDVSIKIPLDVNIIFRGKLIKGESNSKYLSLLYEAKPKETAYRISKTYFNQEVEDLIVRNGLPDSNIKIGQKVVIGWLPSESTQKILYSLRDESQDSMKYIANIEDVEEDVVVFTKQRGIALWSKNSFNSGQRYVLHSSAKINSEIELYNPLVKRTVTAKVIGRIQNGVYQPDIDVILSAATAQSLGALDSRFMIEMKYVK